MKHYGGFFVSCCNAMTPSVTITVWLIVVLMLVATSGGFSQTYTVSGIVRDSSNNEALVAANIRIDGTSKGTITNAEGQYRLSLGVGSYTLVYSFIGYKTDSVHVVVDRNLQRDVFLAPTPILFSEVVVTDEDPAHRIMRQVIENKHRWVEALKSYTFEAFTRQVLHRDTAIASISESYTTGYWQRGDTLREVIKQVRKTANLQAQFGATAVGGIVNFYDDEVRIGGFRFVGPTAADAFSYYDFRLQQTREQDGIELYIIEMIPKSRLVPLFRGTISIAGDSYAVAGVEVTPNEAFSIPFVNNFEYRYAQQFVLYDRQFWMPVDIRINGWFTVSLVGFTLPRIGIDQVSSIYDYSINVTVPDTIFRKPRRIVTKESEKFDSTFWAQHEVLPLTAEEQQAYVTLDSTQTLEKQFRPSGALVVLNDISESALKYIDLRFNRVEGLFLGGEADLDSLTTTVRTWGSLGYGLSDKRWKYRAGLEYFLDSLRHWSVGAEYYRGIDHFPDEGNLSTGTVTLASLLSKDDDHDYFYSRGWKLFAAAKPFSLVSLQLTYRQEHHETAFQRSNYSFFSRTDSYRPNPEVTEGNLRSLSLSIRIGPQSNIPQQLLSQNFVEVEVEHSTPSWFKSDFDFTRLLLRGEVNIQTYAKRLFSAPTLYARLAAGAVLRSTPPQRMFALETQTSGFAPFGTLHTAYPREFVGDRFVMLSLEHNFRNTPFLALDIPFLYKNSIELLVYGSAAQTWKSNRSPDIPGRTTDGWYYEAGIGFGRIFGLFRFDFTQRLSGAPATFFTLGISRFF